MVHRNKGNPNWGKPLPSPSVVATEFESVARRLGLHEENLQQLNPAANLVSAQCQSLLCAGMATERMGIIPDVGWCMNISTLPASFASGKRGTAVKSSSTSLTKWAAFTLARTQVLTFANSW